MKGCLIAGLDVQDQPTFQHYRKEAVPRIVKYSGRYIIGAVRCRS